MYRRTLCAMLLACAISVLMCSTAVAQKTPQKPISIDDTATLKEMGIKVSHIAMNKAPFEMQQSVAKASAAKQARANNTANAMVSTDGGGYGITAAPVLVTVLPSLGWDDKSAMYLTIAEDVYGQSFVLPQDTNPIGETNTFEFLMFDGYLPAGITFMMSEKNFGWPYRAGQTDVSIYFYANGMLTQSYTRVAVREDLEEVAPLISSVVSSKGKVRINGRFNPSRLKPFVSYGFQLIPEWAIQEANPLFVTFDAGQISYLTARSYPVTVCDRDQGRCDTFVGRHLRSQVAPVIVVDPPRKGIVGDREPIPDTPSPVSQGQPSLPASVNTELPLQRAPSKALTNKLTQKQP